MSLAPHTQNRRSTILVAGALLAVIVLSAACSSTAPGSDLNLADVQARGVQPDGADGVLGGGGDEQDDPTPEPTEVPTGPQPGDTLPLLASNGERIEIASGEITSGTDEQTFVLEVADDEAILIKELGCSITDGRLEVSIVGAGISGLEFLDDGDCGENNRYVASNDGTVVIRVTGSAEETRASYSFTVTSATAAAPLPVQFGTVVDAELGDGAGVLSHLGAVDVFTIDMLDDQSVVIYQLDCEFQGDNKVLIYVEGAGINNRATMNEGDCDEAARFTATEDGTLRIAVASEPHIATGTYSFQVLDGTPDAPIAITAGTQVDQDLSPGAANLETPGSRDIYEIELDKRQSIAIQQLGTCEFSGGSSVRFDIEGAGIAGGGTLDEDDCTSIDRFTTDRAGTVAITVYATNNRVSGTYAFNVIDATASEPIQIYSGTDVRPDDPAAGAGRLENFGSVDVYTIDVAAGEILTISQLGECNLSGEPAIRIGVVGGGLNTYDVLEEPGCDKVFEYAATETGTVTINVFNSSNESFGTYSFRTEVSDPEPEPTDEADG